MQGVLGSPHFWGGVLQSRPNTVMACCTNHTAEGGKPMYMGHGAVAALENDSSGSAHNGHACAHRACVMTQGPCGMHALHFPPWRGAHNCFLGVGICRDQHTLCPCGPSPRRRMQIRRPSDEDSWPSAGGLRSLDSFASTHPLLQPEILRVRVQVPSACLPGVSGAAMSSRAG